MIRRKGRSKGEESSDDFDFGEELDSDVASFGEIPVINSDETPTKNPEADAQAAGLQHWSEPPAGMVPSAFEGDQDDSFSGPSWQGSEEEDDSWGGSSDLTEVFSPQEAIEQPVQRPKQNGSGRQRPATRQQNKAMPPSKPSVRKNPASRPDVSNPSQVARRQRPNPNSAKVDPQTEAVRRQAAARAAKRQQAQAEGRGISQGKVNPQREDAGRPQKPMSDRTQARGNRQQRPKPDSFQPETGVDQNPRNKRSLKTGEGGNDRQSSTDKFPADTQQLTKQRNKPSVDVSKDEDNFGIDFGSSRDIPKAILVGVFLAIVSVAAISFSAETAIVLIGLVALLAVSELYKAMNTAGLRPATLLGLVGTVSIPAAAFYRGEASYPLAIGLIVVFGAMWYLVGADNERPVLNLSLTILGIFWIGGLAGFAGLMISSDFDGGSELLLATIAAVAAYDIMAYIGGRAYGANRFHAVSPNKTWEGTLTGVVAALFVGFILGVIPIETIFQDNLTAAVVFGAAIGVLAPVGDLAESLIKRDLGIKDMGGLLPGHGGILDRVDGLLFALPGAYYVAMLFELISF